MAWEFFTITISGIDLISPEDDATEIHSNALMWAEINHEELTVSDVQLYLNDVKVYDDVPVGPDPFVVWSVGAYCEPDTEYDWKVTATVEGNVWTSATWTFTTAKPADRSPSFKWYDSGSPYDIYFGTDPDDLDLIVEDWIEPEWDWGEGDWVEPGGGEPGHWVEPGEGDGSSVDPDWSWYPIDYDTEYYWKINDGPVFEFTTTPLYPPQWQAKSLRLIVAANNKIFYESI